MTKFNVKISTKGKDGGEDSVEGEGESEYLDITDVSILFDPQVVIDNIESEKDDCSLGDLRETAEKEDRCPIQHSKS